MPAPGSRAATSPSATRAAVSRAEARSRIGRASPKAYFCIPTRSACPGRGRVSGRLRPISWGALMSSAAAYASSETGIGGHHGLPLGPLAVADHDRQRRTKASNRGEHRPRKVTGILLEGHPGTAPEAEAAARERRPDVRRGDLDTRRQPLDRGDQRLTVRLTRSQPAQHTPDPSTPVSAGGRAGQNPDSMRRRSWSPRLVSPATSQ
jgi:hypothetical protein